MTTLDIAPSPWQVREADYPLSDSDGARARFLVNYALLAPSTRNTQPWRFTVSGNRIDVSADLSRWQRIADRDRRELEISVGCALENLVIAADHFGYHADVAYRPVDDRLALLARVWLSPAAPGVPRERPAGLFNAIQSRHTGHGRFTLEPVRAPHHRRLTELSLEPGVRLWLDDSVQTRTMFDAITGEATMMAYRDPAFRRELGAQIGEGLLGTPPILSALGQFAVTHFDVSRRIAQRESRLLASSPMLGLIATTSDDAIARVRAGQVFERLCLLATLLGLSVQPMSQALEAPSSRAQVAALIPGPPLFAQLAFRVGYATTQPWRHTPRHPFGTMVIGGPAPR
jgi:nitroreductase